MNSARVSVSSSTTPISISSSAPDSLWSVPCRSRSRAMAPVNFDCSRPMIDATAGVATAMVIRPGEMRVGEWWRAERHQKQRGGQDRNGSGSPDRGLFPPIAADRAAAPTHSDAASGIATTRPVDDEHRDRPPAVARGPDTVRQSSAWNYRSH